MNKAFLIKAMLSNTTEKSYADSEEKDITNAFKTFDKIHHMINVNFNLYLTLSTWSEVCDIEKPFPLVLAQKLPCSGPKVSL